MGSRRSTRSNKSNRSNRVIVSKRKFRVPKPRSAQKLSNYDPSHPHHNVVYAATGKGPVPRPRHPPGIPSFPYLAAHSGFKITDTVPAGAVFVYFFAPEAANPVTREVPSGQLDTLKPIEQIATGAVWQDGTAGAPLYAFTAGANYFTFPWQGGVDPRTMATNLNGPTGVDYNTDTATTMMYQQFMGGSVEATVSAAYQSSAAVTVADADSNPALYGQALPTSCVDASLVGQALSLPLIERFPLPTALSGNTIATIASQFQTTTIQGGSGSSTKHFHMRLIPSQNTWVPYSGNAQATGTNGNSLIGGFPCYNNLAMISAGHGFMIVNNSAATQASTVTMSIQLAYSQHILTSKTFQDATDTQVSNPSFIVSQSAPRAIPHAPVTPLLASYTGVGTTAQEAHSDMKQGMEKSSAQRGLDISKIISPQHTPTPITSASIAPAASDKKIDLWDEIWSGFKHVGGAIVDKVAPIVEKAAVDKAGSFMEDLLA